MLKWGVTKVPSHQSGCRSTLLFLLLIGIGLLGNYFNSLIFYRVEFIFGSIFTILAVVLFGTTKGVIATLIVSSYTFFAWHHPFVMVTITGEALFIGLAISSLPKWSNRGPSRENNIVLLSSIYWLIIGIPLTFVFFLQFLGVSFEGTMMLALKHSINGVFNALIATILLQCLAFLNFGQGFSARIPTISFRSLTLSSFLLLTFFLTIFFASRHVDRQIGLIEENIVTDLHSHSLILRHIVADWIDRQVVVVEAIASHIGNPDDDDPALIQERLPQWQKAAPSFSRIAILNSDATSIAYLPIMNDLGTSNIGVNYSDRPFFAELHATLKPVISDVLLTRTGTPQARISIAAVVFVEDQIRGYVGGIINTSELARWLERIATVPGHTQHHLTLIDSSGNIIASTRDDLPPLTPYDPSAQVLIKNFDNDISLAMPPRREGFESRYEEWKNSTYTKMSHISANNRWRLVVETPAAPLMLQLDKNAREVLLVTWMTMLLVLVLSIVASKMLTAPLVRLRHIGQMLPETISAGRPVLWKEEPISEINALINCFKRMERDLRANMTEIKDLNTNLEQKVIAKTTELLEIKERHDLAIEAASIGIFDLDIATGAFVVTERYAQIFDNDDLLFTENLDSWKERIHPDDRPRVFSLLSPCLDGIQSSLATEFRQKKTDDSFTWISCKGIVKHDENNRPVRIVGTVTDISERKAYQENLEDKTAEMERFIYTASHDLKTPLVTISTFLGILQYNISSGDEQQIQQNIHYIDTAAKKMARLLDDLIEISRVGRIVHQFQDINALQLIQEALTLAGGIIRTRGVHVQITVPEIYLYGDRQRLLEVWQNLIENSIKYMGDQQDPSLELGAESKENEVVFFVRDNGIGIESEFHSHIFGLFNKLDHTTEGSGLGLAMVKRIIELHQGQIWVESAGKGQGSCFYFTLPAALINQETST